MKTILFSLLIFINFNCQKNVAERVTTDIDYSGNYTSAGYYYHPYAPRDINKPKIIYRHTSTSFLCGIGDIPTFMGDDSAWSVVLVVDPLTNGVMVSEYPDVTNGPGRITMYSSGLPSPFVSQWSRSGECDNTYDPDTKEFKLRYGYYINNGDQRVIEEIVKKD